MSDVLAAVLLVLCGVLYIAMALRGLFRASCCGAVAVIVARDISELEGAVRETKRLCRGMRIVILDAGLDEEARKKAELLAKRWGARLCRAGRIEKLLTEGDGVEWTEENTYR